MLNKITNFIKSQFVITFSKSITLPSLIFIIGLTLFSVLIPDSTLHAFNAIKGWMFKDMSWFYIFVVSSFLIFLIFIAFSRYGSIKLGRDDSKPDYSYFSWVSMLFAAGMGIGLMFFGVAEPISHLNDPALQGLEPLKRIEEAQLLTFFHWGIHGWSIYAIVGLSLAYFSYRLRLPLSMRSALYPILKKRIYGRWGDLVDVIALCSTFIGMTTSLGFGVAQINAGLENVGLVSSVNFGTQCVIVSLVMFVAILSAISGVSKGVKYLSQLNVVMAVLLMLFVLFTGPTIKILSSFSSGLGLYFTNIFDLSLNTRIYEPEYENLFNNWTVFFWAWWIAWSPYVGLFIARISKGRTIREFIVTVLLVPSLFIFLWITILGNNAMFMDVFEVNGVLSEWISKPEILLFKFLENRPLVIITSTLSIIILSIFFITSADSGIYVMNNIACKDAKNSPNWQKAFWGILMAFLALALLNLGGLDSLQSAIIISSLPFAFIIIFFMICLLKALVLDDSYFSTKFSHSTRLWSGENWREQLEKVVTYDKKKDIKKYIETIVSPAFVELKNELKKNDIQAEIKEIKNSRVGIAFRIRHGNMKDFTYSVRAHVREMSDAFIEDDNAPNFDSERYYIPFTYFENGRLGYDIQYYTKDEIISDVLKQYERYLSIACDEDNSLLLVERRRK